MNKKGQAPHIGNSCPFTPFFSAYSVIPPVPLFSPERLPPGKTPRNPFFFPW